MKIDGSGRDSTGYVISAFIAVVALLLLLASPAVGQSTPAPPSSPDQATPKSDQSPVEAGGPGGDVGPMAVPKKKESSDDDAPLLRSRRNKPTYRNTPCMWMCPW